MAAFKVPHGIPARPPKRDEERSEPKSSRGATDSVSASGHSGGDGEQPKKYSGQICLLIIFLSQCAVFFTRIACGGRGRPFALALHNAWTVFLGVPCLLPVNDNDEGALCCAALHVQPLLWH